MAAAPARYSLRHLTYPSQPARPPAFLAGAASYDDSSTAGTRTLANHERWLAQFTCPVLELRGDLSVAVRVAAVRERLPPLGLA